MSFSITNELQKACILAQTQAHDVYIDHIDINLVAYDMLIKQNPDAVSNHWIDGLSKWQGISLEIDRNISHPQSTPDFNIYVAKRDHRAQINLDTMAQYDPRDYLDIQPHHIAAK